MVHDFSVEVFTTDNKEKARQAFEIRRKVFVDEQKVSPEEEYDEYEDIARHFLLVVDGRSVGTARWRLTEKGVKLERFAVLPEFRNLGAGSLLVKSVLKEVMGQHQHIYLHAQVAAMRLYERAGFKATGPLFYEAGIPHYKMTLDLSASC